jgi:hypothetical protein
VTSTAGPAGSARAEEARQTAGGRDTARAGPDTANPPSRGARLATRLALLIALLGLLQPGIPARSAVLSAIVMVVLLVASTRWRVDALAILVLLVAGVGLRSSPSAGFSDVLTVTEAAIRLLLEGANPYGHGFVESQPPGASFAYGPLVLLWYLPALDDPGTMERLAAFLVLGVLALRGRPLGLAVYAVTPVLVVAATDGSNDTSAGLILLVALLTSLRWPVPGGVLLALATAFKPYALAWLPGLVGYAGSVVPLLAFLVASVAAWLLPAVAWGLESLLWSFRRADEVHAQPYYSLAFALSGESVPQSVWQALRIGAGAMLAIVSLIWSRSAAGFLISGTLVFGATLFLGWWSTFAYLAAVAPVLCWHLDEWLGLARDRVVWPGDPVGRWSAALDLRWPLVRASS